MMQSLLLLVTVGRSISGVCEEKVSSDRLATLFVRVWYWCGTVCPAHTLCLPVAWLQTQMVDLAHHVSRIRQHLVVHLPQTWTVL
jgi:hypothetical protein